MIYPVIDNVVELNRRLIHLYGGYYSPPCNFSYENGLKWVLDAIQYPLFGNDLCPRLCDKAALLGATIIRDHVFFDGNKRTGIASIELILRLNGFFLIAEKNETISIALTIVDQNFILSQLTDWIIEHTI